MFFRANDGNLDDDRPVLSAVKIGCSLGTSFSTCKDFFRQNRIISTGRRKVRPGIAIEKKLCLPVRVLIFSFLLAGLNLAAVCVLNCSLVL